MLILGQMIVFFLMIFAGALARRYSIIIPNKITKIGRASCRERV